MSDMTVTFYGATETVTGSRYLVENGDAAVLVDCGMFQGYKALRERNWAATPFRPRDVHAVVLTHAHIDHSGYLPKLVKDGFRGKIYCTPGTSDLLHVLLRDSAYLMEEDARRAARGGYSRHKSPLPLYDKADAERCLKQLHPVAFQERFHPAEGATARFTRAGHIVGSACVRLAWPKTSITFSGDVGRPHDPIMNPPDVLESTDALVIESTYGDRRHPAEDVRDVLCTAVNRTAAAGGTLVVPAFAVGRSQHLLHILASLKAEDRIPDIPIALDSPMAINATGIFCENKADHRLTDEECSAMCAVARYSQTPEESKSLDRSSQSQVIVSASGMLTGGRILHHLRRFLPFEKNTVLLVGYQASGTRGRTLVDGVEELKIHGQYVPVRASVVQVGGLSAHADHVEMTDWLKASGIAPEQTFVTHGEPAAADAFRRRLKEELGWNAVVPTFGSTWSIP